MLRPISGYHGHDRRKKNSVRLLHASLLFVAFLTVYILSAIIVVIPLAYMMQIQDMTYGEIFCGVSSSLFSEPTTQSSLTEKDPRNEVSP